MTAGGEQDAGGFARLSAELADRFDAGVDASWPDFGEVALRVFQHQFEANPAYRAFAAGRGARPGAIADWREVPAVPATAFKHLELVSGPRAAVERVFRTSGTTRGTEGRGAHLVLSLALYRAAALPNLTAHLLPEGGRIRILSLVPAAEDQPHSSLSTMIGFAMAELGAEGSGVHAHPEHGVDVAGLDAALERAVDDGVPVLVAATSFALVQWLDGSRARMRLPEGSRVMETGGFKGRTREVSRDRLYAAIGERLGVPARRVVNEYGMTELLSQFWEPVLREGSDADRRLVGPPWVRTRVLDPVTLEELPGGEPGLLCHVDLANVGSVAAVLTQDLGIAVGDGFHLLGRAPGAEPRGCSLALEELLAAGSR